MLVGVAWALWLAAWITRVELRHALEPMIRELGLAWLPQGLGPRVSARGEFDGRPVELVARSRRGSPAVRVRLVGGRWQALPAEPAVGAVRAALGIAPTPPER